MALLELLQALGEEIQDPDEETFLLFTYPIPSQNLGFIDAKAKDLDLTVSGRVLSITQSPGLLSSNRKGGTTGAVVWRITPLFAEWITLKDNALFMTCVLGKDSLILELGCGVSGVIAITLAPKVGRYVATDQKYVFKLLKSNINANALKQETPKKAKSCGDALADGMIDVLALDWELDSVTDPGMILRITPEDGLSQSPSAIIACDCIYNESLIAPFVRTCIELCKNVRANGNAAPTICIIAQQLRSASVFEAWLLSFHQAFRVWRVPDRLLMKGLRKGSGFVVHIGVLRTVNN